MHYILYFYCFFYFQDNGNISIAKITREKMLKRQQEIMKEVEERRITKEREQHFQQSSQEQMKQIELESQTLVQAPLDTYVKEQELPAEPVIVENDFPNSIPEPVKSQTPTKQTPSNAPQSVTTQNKRTASAQRKGAFFALCVHYL